MAHDTTADIAGLLTPGGLHPRCYADDAVFQRELDRIFARAWVYAGHAAQVPAVGDYATFMIGRQPMLLVHAGDGLRVLHNRCPHRGAMVCDAPQGHAGDGLTCAQHGWRFRLDGSGLAIPGGADARLTPAARVAIHHGFVFASLAADGPPPGGMPGAGLAVLDALPARSVPAGTRAIEAMNWKRCLEKRLGAAPDAAAAYPSLVVEPSRRIVAALRPLTVDRTLVETWAFGAGDAPARASAEPAADNGWLAAAWAADMREA